MKRASSAQKTTRTSTRFASLEASTGPNGIAIAPPAYGIEVVDRELMEAGPESDRAYQPLAVGGWSGGDGTIQRRLQNSGRHRREPDEREENNTGLPDQLKAGIETLSGLTMDDVRVHYNSTKPVQLQALAYTQGTDIYVGSGQERHLPHEAWHVVQQKQGRVKPTLQLSGVQINDDDKLEKEANVMELKASQGKTMLQKKPLVNANVQNTRLVDTGPLIMQRAGSNYLAVRVIQPVFDHRNPYSVIQLRTWGQWATDVWSMTTSSLTGWLIDIPTRLQNIFLDVPESLVNELSPLIGYIGNAVAGNNVATNLKDAAATLFGSASRAALRLVFGVLDLLPLTPIFEIINVAVNQHLRPMNPGELAAANATYGTRPNLWSRVRVSHDDQFLLRVFSYVAGGGNWNAFIGLATYHMIRLQNLGGANANMQNTVHELGHMVQFDRRGATYTMAEAAAHGAIGGYAYTYANLVANPLNTFNREQQCRIGEHGWAVNNGGHPNDYLGSLPAGASAAPLLAVQAVYNARLAQWQANQI